MTAKHPRRKPSDPDYQIALRSLVHKNPIVLVFVVLALVLAMLLLRLGPPELRQLLCGEFFLRKMPDGPLPGQYDAAHCPTPYAVIRRACWFEIKGADCRDWYEYEGRCYAPVPWTAGQPTKPNASFPIHPSTAQVVDADFK